MMYSSTNTRAQREGYFQKQTISGTEELLRPCTSTLCGNNDAIAAVFPLQFHRLHFLLSIEAETLPHGGGIQCIMAEGLNLMVCGSS